VYTFFEKYILHELHFFANFCFSNGKVVQFLLPQPKNRSRAYAPKGSGKKIRTTVLDVQEGQIYT